MISYAGVNLCLDSKEADEWINTYFGSWDHYFAEAQHRTAQAFAWMQRANIKPPRPGTLIWPNGATRWAVGCFLASASQLLSIGPDSTQPRPLLLNGVSFSLVSLPPIPVSYNGTDGLFALVLVDARYYWRFVDCSEWMIDDEDVSEITDTSKDGTRNPRWSELITDVIQARMREDLSISSLTINKPDISDEYLRADIETLGKVDHGNDTARTAAQLLEAVALNIGAEVVVDFDGTVNLVNVDNADRFNSVANSFVRITGFDYNSSLADLSANTLPERVKILYRKINPAGELLGSYHEVERDVGGNVGTKVIADTCKAICDDADADPENEDALDRLAGFIATDWYERFRYNFHVVYAGICNFTPNSISDIIEFTYTHNTCFTRVKSRGINAEFDRLNHQDPDAPFTVSDRCCPRLVSLTDHAYSTMSGTATATLLDEAGTPIDGADPIEVVVDLTAARYFGFAFSDDKLYVTSYTNGNYRPVSCGYQTVKGQTDGTIASGASGAVSVYYQGSDTGVNVTAYHEGLADGTIAASATVYVTWMHQRWVITAVECA